MRTKEITTKAVEMIKSGTTEIWSASLGNLTLGNVKTISSELKKLGYNNVILVNSNDNAIKVI